MLAVGIPREIKPGEKRVGLTPRGARDLANAGIRVLVEKGAGEGSGFSDSEYEKAGAKRVRKAEELYRKAGLIKKVKEPYGPELARLRPDLVLFCFLHLASPENLNLVRILLERKVTALGLETVEKNGRTLILEPMSAIAGTLAAFYAGFFKQYVRAEKEKVVYPARFLEKLEMLATHYPEIPEKLNPGRAFIFGGGTVGSRAAEALLKMGGEVELVEKRLERRKELAKEFGAFGSRFHTWSPEDSFQAKMEEADVWFGCVHVTGERALGVIPPEALEKLSRRRKRLIMDVAADQGGNFPETRTTLYENPLYLDSFGNLRFAVTNIPSLCGKGAAEAIEKVSLTYTLQLAQDWKKALRELPELQKGVQTYQGKLVHEAVARAHGLPWERFQAP